MVVVLSAKGSEFQNLGAVTEKDLPPTEDKQNLGTHRSSELEDRSERKEYTEIVGRKDRKERC